MDCLCFRFTEILEICLRSNFSSRWNIWSKTFFPYWLEQSYSSGSLCLEGLFVLHHRRCSLSEWPWISASVSGDNLGPEWLLCQNDLNPRQIEQTQILQVAQYWSQILPDPHCHSLYFQWAGLICHWLSSCWIRNDFRSLKIWSFLGVISNFWGVSDIIIYHKLLSYMILSW